jgi:hypothetical protein
MPSQNVAASAAIATYLTTTSMLSDRHVYGRRLR